jgi:DNA repair protein RecO (recombination protein O)
MSNRERLYRTRAVILSRRDYNDADRILTVFTPELGKRELIAKGIRKTTSRKAGHLEPLSHTSLLVAQARTWDIITEAVTVESFRHLREDLDAIGCASYVSEVVISFTEADDDSQPLWDLLLFTLRTLDEHCRGEIQCEPTLLLRWFELHLLNHTGFQPQLFYCLACDNPLQPVLNYLSLSEGGIYCGECGVTRNDIEAIDPDVLKILRYLQSHPWADVSKLTVRPYLLQQCESILYRYLLTILEHHLKSTDFLRKLRATMPAISS